MTDNLYKVVLLRDLKHLPKKTAGTRLKKSGRWFFIADGTEELVPMGDCPHIYINQEKDKK